jgi:hypothetical protein
LESIESELCLNRKFFIALRIWANCEALAHEVWMSFSSTYPMHRTVTEIACGFGNFAGDLFNAVQATVAGTPHSSNLAVH